MDHKTKVHSSYNLGLENKEIICYNYVEDCSLITCYLTKNRLFLRPQLSLKNKTNTN